VFKKLDTGSRQKQKHGNIPKWWRVIFAKLATTLGLIASFHNKQEEEQQITLHHLSR